MRRCKNLQSALIARAELDLEWSVMLPGYTHFQRAQPILLSHWWLSHLWALQRDRERLRQLRERTAVWPLGAGALAGTAFPIDREALAHDWVSTAPRRIVWMPSPIEISPPSFCLRRR